jgi:hypothetical protein
MQSLALIPTSFPACFPLSHSFSLSMLSSPNARYAMVIAACLFATFISLLTWSRRRGSDAAVAHDGPLASIAPIAGPHEALIRELLHCARHVHREGIASLAHPLSHSPDPEIAYAMSLVASHVDPRIVRGVLLDRLIERCGDAAGFLQSTAPGRRAFARAGFFVLIGSAACLWQLSRMSGEASPVIAASAFALWCGGGITWFAASRRADAGANSLTRDSAAMERGMLILTAAELIAGGVDAQTIEQKLREMVGSRPSTSSLANAA